MTGTLREDQWIFLVMSRSFFLTMRNVSDKSYRENNKTYFVFCTLFFLENRVVYDIMWKNIV